MIEKLSEKIRPTAEKLLKNKKAAFIMIIGLSGMLLIALSSFGGETKETPKETDIKQTARSETELETNLERFLSNINGAGNVAVMITYESGNETVYATDNEKTSSKNGDAKDEIKTSSEHIIIKTDGNESGLEIKEIYPKVRGIAVICEGGNNPVIKGQITEILCALFDINSTQISVAQVAV